MPTYIFVKNFKKEKGFKVNKWTYSDWFKENININLKRGTSVLNLKYKDTSKDLIIPVLNQISKSYQKFSGKERETGIKQGINFLYIQRDKYKSKSIESLRNVLSFAIDNDLQIIPDDTSDNNLLGLNIESIRVKASNEIRSLDEKIKVLRNYSPDNEAITFFIKNNPNLTNDPIIEKLDEIDKELASKRSIFTENDKVIKNLKTERKAIQELIRAKTFDYLNSLKDNAIATKKASERPKKVLVKYRELLAESLKNSSLLQNIESQLSLLELEDSKEEDPWELITIPTLEEEQVSPKNLRTLLIFSLFGFISGTIYALYKEKSSGIIFDVNSLEKLIKDPIIANFSIDNISNKDIKETVSIISHNLNLDKSSSPKKLTFVICGKVEKLLIDYILELFKSFLKDYKFEVTEDLNKIDKNSFYYFITSLHAVKSYEIKNLNYKFKLLREYNASWIILPKIKPAESNIDNK